FKHIGHPLFGDATYGGDKQLYGQKTGSLKAFIENTLELMPRQALHAKSLGFRHPTTKQIMQFDSDLPDDFKIVLERWQKLVNGK
ncbi:MAG: RNA pseudouridine synthase, partial [Bacteroidota bacterium]|nr:RNA pseudouridine synthase [Bacteroidota bacterium]